MPWKTTCSWICKSQNKYDSTEAINSIKLFFLFFFLAPKPNILLSQAIWAAYRFRENCVFLQELHYTVGQLVKAREKKQKKHRKH